MHSQNEGDEVTAVAGLVAANLIEAAVLGLVGDDLVGAEVIPQHE